MTQIDLGLTANNALYLLSGYALLYALGLVRMRAGDLRLAGLSYLAGWALSGTALSFELMAGITLRPATLAITTALIVVLCTIARRRWPNNAPPAMSWNSSLTATATTLVAGSLITIGAAAALVTALSSQWTPELDLLSVWLPRAEIVYYLHHLDPGQWASFIDPWYPPLVPVMFATTFQFIGGVHPSVLPVQQVLLGIAFVTAVLALLDRYVPRWISFSFMAALMVTPFFWWRLQSLMPDATLAYLLVAGATAALIWLHQPNAAWLVLGMVFLAAATLAKLEGLVFAGLLVTVILVASAVLHGRQAKQALLLAIGPAASIPWRLWLDTHQVAATNPDFNQPRLLSPTFLAGRAGDFAHALRLLLTAPWGNTPTTTEAFLVLGAITTLCVARVIPVLATAALVWLGLMIIALAAIYATDRLSISAYFPVSAPRVGGMFVVTAATLTPLLLGIALGRYASGTSRPPTADAQAPGQQRTLKPRLRG
jgi:hypothetical protein